MSLFMISNFWSLTKLILIIVHNEPERCRTKESKREKRKPLFRLIISRYRMDGKVCLTITGNSLEAHVASQKTQFLFAEVVIDSKNCTLNESLWTLQQEIVFETLKKHPELGLSGSGKYCGCKVSEKVVCKTEHDKAVLMLLYNIKTGSVDVQESKLVSLETELGSIPPYIVPDSEQPYYVCANLEIVTPDDANYKTCMNQKDFNNTMAKSQAQSQAKSQGDSTNSESVPGTATIVGATFGALAALGLLSALAWLASRHIKNGRQVDDSGSSSDISPIIPGSVGFGEAPSSVPPAGTS